MRKRLSAPEWQLSLTEGTGENGASPTRSASSSSAGSLDLEVDELETPSDSEQLDSGHEFEWEGGSQAKVGPVEIEAGRKCSWRRMDGWMLTKLIRPAAVLAQRVGARPLFQRTWI